LRLEAWYETKDVGTIILIIKELVSQAILACGIS